MNTAAGFLLVCVAVVLDLAVDAKKVINLGHQKLFEGDIQMPKRNRNGILAAQRWPSNTIFYDYGASWSQEQIAILHGAMKEIQDNTICIKFVKRTNQPNYISIFNGTGCNSPVGYTNSGVQQVSLQDRSDGTCWTHATVVHELLHTVGLWHEQSRYDRDDYVTINFNNVDFCERYNYDITSSASSNTYGVPYNYLSVMQYEKTAFSSDQTSITMITKDPSYMDLIGKAEKGAPSDYDKVKRIYKCGIYQNFVAPPVKLATTASTSDYGCVNVDCIDECASAAAGGQCQSNPDMKKMCPKSCNFCPNAALPNPPTAACADTEAECATWAADGNCNGDAAGWADFMTRNCPKSCGICSGLGPAISCIDKELTRCGTWVSQGQCTANPAYMDLYCAKSCGKC